MSGQADANHHAKVRYADNNQCFYRGFKSAFISYRDHTKERQKQPFPEKQ